MCENNEMKFSRKGYGRIFVEKPSDILKVENIIKQIDEFEFEYYPTGNYVGGDNKRLVTVFSEDNYESVYVGKFDDMDIGLVLKKAWAEGIHCFAVFGKCNELDGF